MGSSSTSVGRRCPDSRRDSVLTEMPVAADSWASVPPRWCRTALSRSPTASRVWVGSGWSMHPVCQSSKFVCHPCRGRRRLSAMDLEHDVIVIGGGPAGLSAATALARSRRRVLVLDQGRPRNATAGHLHNFLTRDGTAPADLLAIGRSEVESFGGVVQHGEVLDVRAEEGGGFTVVADAGEASTRRLLVTTGLSDRLPDIPGVADRWGRDVLHCPYCHGYEVRDQAVGILAAGPLAGHAAGLWRQLTDRVTVFVHDGPSPDPAEQERFDGLGVSVVEGAVAELVV